MYNMKRRGKLNYTALQPSDYISYDYPRSSVSPPSGCGNAIVIIVIAIILAGFISRCVFGFNL